jgi:4-hydroxybenzoate polyprenyltransferase
MKSTTTLWTILGTVFTTSIIRSFIEFFSNPEPLFHISPWFVTLNYFLCFLSLIIGIGYIMSRIVREPALKWIRVAALYSPIIFLAPLVDLIISNGKGICMGYLGSGGALLLHDLITFFGSLTKCGISPGMRIEIFIILAAISRIIWVKTKSTSKTILAALLSYLLIFATGAPSGILALVHGNTSANSGAWFIEMISQGLIGTAHGYLSLTADYFIPHALSLVMARIHLITAIVFGIIILWKEAPHHIRLWINNSRWERVLYYIALPITGALIAHSLNQTGNLNSLDGIGIITGTLSIITACWAAAVWNDYHDTSIDAISNTNRPLHTHVLSQETYIAYGLLFFVISIISALLINYPFFFCILTFQLAYGIYSYKGTHWKKHFVTSALTIGFIGMVMVVMGYLFVQPNQSLGDLPLSILLSIFVTLSIVSQVKDFKDVAGDKADSIQTLPVLLGKRKASLFLLITLTIWLIFLGYFFNHWIITAQIIPWIIIDLGIRKKIPEYWRFILFFIQIALMCYLFL